MPNLYGQVAELHHPSDELRRASVIVLEPVDEQQFWLAVAESELFSRRFALGLGTRIPEALQERLRYSPLETWSADDRKAVVAAVQELPSPTLGLLRGIRIGWFDATLGSNDLEALRIVPTPDCASLAPDGRLASLVASLERGMDTADAELSGGYRRLSRAFRLTEMRGRPCLVASKREGPYTIVEGLTRLAVLFRRATAESPFPTPLPAYLGLSEGLPSWGSAPRSGEGDPGEGPTRPDYPETVDKKSPGAPVMRGSS